MLAPKLLYNLLTTPGNVVESQAKGKTDEHERCKERRDEVRDREASQACDTLWTVTSYKIIFTEDHHGGRHTFLISWEGFNFLRVHGPPTD